MTTKWHEFLRFSRVSGKTVAVGRSHTHVAKVRAEMEAVSASSLTALQRADLLRPNPSSHILQGGTGVIWVFAQPSRRYGCDGKRQLD